MTATVPHQGAGESARVRDVVRAARKTRGFMPDDEGEALLHAALRAGATVLPSSAPPTFVEIGAWCGKSSLYLGAAAEAIPALCGDAGFAAEVVQFLKDHPLASGPRRVAQSVERLGVNVAFAGRERDRLADSLGAVVATSETA